MSTTYQPRIGDRLKSLPTGWTFEVVESHEFSVYLADEYGTKHWYSLDMVQTQYAAGRLVKVAA